MLYDINQSFEYNVAYGPFGDLKVPKVPAAKKLRTKLLGHTVDSVFGIPACPLTVNSRFILHMAKLGYDVLTYKSMRSVEWHGNVAPHWRYVDTSQQLTVKQFGKSMEASENYFTGQEPSMANSFGIQSVRSEFWQEDVNTTITQLPKGKLLILSLMCTPQAGEKLIVDAKRLAKLANETRAKVFELNLACPNTDGGQGLIYEDVQHSLRLCEVMKKVLGKKKLLVKVGYYSDQQMLKTFLQESKGMIDGIATTNTYSMKIEDGKGKEVFPNRPTAGVSGAAIRSLSLEQAQHAVEYTDELGLKNFAIIGIGGVTQPKHIEQYLELGVDAVQSAVGVFADPMLAVKWKKLKK